MGQTDRAGPPRPRLTFRVGVVGHRPDRLPSDPAELAGLRRRLSFVLEAAKARVRAFADGPDAVLYDDESPALTAVSALAEGVDRLFAATALDAGYRLIAPMPFARAEFEEDFDEPEASAAEARSASLAEFHAILERAERGPGLTCFELDGRRDQAQSAYGAAGRVVLNQSDLLIVVWDGGPARGRGGTLETLREAIGFQVPVLWVEPWPPFAWAMLTLDADLTCLDSESPCSPPWSFAQHPAEDERALAEAVAAIVKSELEPPTLPAAESGGGGDDREEARARTTAWFAARAPRIDPFILWKLFRDLVGEGRLRIPNLRVESPTAHPPPEWRVAEDEAAAGPMAFAGAPPSLSRLLESLWPPFAFADRLADYYADAHRSGFIAASLLAAMVVFAALIPVALGVASGPRAGIDLIFISGEGVILLVLGASFFLARRGRWHERWLEYRMLAEWIRQLRFLIPLGGGRPLPRSQAHLTVYGEPTQSWMYWQVRAIARDVGLPNAVCDSAYIGGCLDHLRAVVGDDVSGQIGFHRVNAERSDRIQRRLHAITSALLATTIAAVVLNFAMRAGAHGPLIDLADRAGSLLIVLSAGLPALGAALANINNLGEFAHMAKRSRALRAAFERLKSEIDTLRRRAGPTGAPPMSEVASLASRMAAVMVEEGVDWRVVMLELPHSAT
ncbi:MAG: hypothetical protein ACYC8V_00845 [Caulobacteraceae bacterium]